ncbi:hypothetical protein JQK62_18695, partial [Leptospira santarosai]|nr:hypothetical protein [Leptospira santarosai]
MLTKLLDEKSVINLIDKEADIIIPIANGEPIQLLDLLEEHASELSGVKIHQMLALHPRKYILGEMPGQLSHVSYFLSGATRKTYQQAKMELVPNNFHEVPRMLSKVTKMSMIFQ